MTCHSGTSTWTQNNTCLQSPIGCLQLRFGMITFHFHQCPNCELQANPGRLHRTLPDSSVSSASKTVLATGQNGRCAIFDLRHHWTSHSLPPLRMGLCHWRILQRHATSRLLLLFGDATSEDVSEQGLGDSEQCEEGLLEVFNFFECYSGMIREPNRLLNTWSCRWYLCQLCLSFC